MLYGIKYTHYIGNPIYPLYRESLNGDGVIIPHIPCFNHGMWKNQNDSERMSEIWSKCHVMMVFLQASGCNIELLLSLLSLLSLFIVRIQIRRHDHHDLRARRVPWVPRSLCWYPGCDNLVKPWWLVTLWFPIVLAVLEQESGTSMAFHGIPWLSISQLVESLCRATSCKCQCILFALKALPHMKRWSNVWHVSEMDTHIHIYSTAKTHWILHGQWILKPANLIDLQAGVLPSSFWGHRL
jgi:hypothetical protein